LIADAGCYIKSNLPNLKANGRLYLFTSYLCFKTEDKTIFVGSNVQERTMSQKVLKSENTPMNTVFKWHLVTEVKKISKD
jgi:hypothetical protein